MAAWVYVAKNEADEVLYVGFTGHPMKRFKQHQKGSPWAPLARSLTWTGYPTKGQALAAEQQLIASLRPPFNITYNPGASRAGGGPCPYCGGTFTSVSHHRKFCEDGPEAGAHRAFLKRLREKRAEAEAVA